MKTLTTYNNELAERVQLATLLDETHAVTTSGLKFISEWSEIAKNEKFNTSTAAVLNNFMSASIRISDPAVQVLRENVHTIMSENTHGIVLAIIAENTKDTENSLQTVFNKTVSEILDNSESDIKESIIGGSLNAFSGIAGVSDLINMTRTDEHVKHVDDFTSYHPISYVEENSDGVFVRIGQIILKLDENFVTPSNAPSAVFAHMSNIIEHVQYDADGAFFIAETSFGKFHITENVISHIEESKTTDLTPEEFAKHALVIVESRSTNAVSRQVAENSRRYADAIIAIADNFSSIAQLDTITVAEHKSGREHIVFVENANRYYVGVIESFRQPRSFTNYASVSEALAEFKSKTSIDLSDQYTDALTNENSLSAKRLNDINVATTELAAVNDTITAIEEQFKLAEEGSDAWEKLTEAYTSAKTLHDEYNAKLKAFQTV